MAIDLIDRYSRGQSICHRWPARLKLLLVLAVILTSAMLPVGQWAVQAGLAALGLLGLVVAQVPLLYVLQRMAVLAPFVLCVALSAPLSHGFHAGWEMAATLLTRASVSFLAGFWLVNVTPFDRLLLAFSKLGVPRILIELLAFTYRYIFVLFDELGRMQHARRARSFGGQSAWFEWKISAQLIGMLLIRAMNRAERIYGAMCARHWTGRIRPLD